MRHWAGTPKMAQEERIRSRGIENMRPLACFKGFPAACLSLALALSASLPAHAQSPLAGSWYFSDGVDTAAFTFFANGEYKFAQVGPADLTGHSGIERGSWAWDAGTGILTAAVVTDTNGEWGLSH